MRWIALFLLVGCIDSEDADAAEKRWNEALIKQSHAEHRTAELETKAGALRDEMKALGRLKEGRQPQYLLKLRVKQFHYTLDPFEHAKDAAQALEMELPTSKEFYDATAVNTELKEEFRWGSLLVRGSAGSWDVTVIGKRVQ